MAHSCRYRPARMAAQARQRLSLHAWLRGVNGERGQAFAEFALIIPFFMVVIFAIVEFSLIVTDQVSLTNAAREGARAGALKGGTSSTAVTAAQNAATGLTQCPLSSPTATYSGSPQQVTVTVTCSYTSLTPLSAVIRLIGGSINTNLNLSATTEMRVEQ
jgi:Flp pilus assembly protein TadG